MEYDQLIEKIIHIRDQSSSGLATIDDPLQELRSVGPDKPLGFLSLNTVQELGQDYQSLEKEFQQKGLGTIVFQEGECHTIGGALYVYDASSLHALLDANETILVESHWPKQVDQFIRQVATQDAQPKTQIFNLVADAFGDTANPNRR